MTTALPILDDAPHRPLFAQGPRSIGAIRLLRMSLTDRCNLRCVYCMPSDGVAFAPRSDLLTARDYLAVAAASQQIPGGGAGHFKITGGEPTVRDDLLTIVEGLAALGPDDLSMTTNGLLLDRLAPDLRRAGLDRLTVSLDTLRADRFSRIAGANADGFDRVRRGIDAAVAAGYERLKINVVVIGGLNDDEVVDFARLTLDRPWTVRFIEYMPLGEASLLEDGLSSARDRTVDNAVVARRIEQALGPLTPAGGAAEPGVGPAQVFELAGAAGRVGFISAMSRPFCETCNRLRLTAAGELRACLFDGGEVDVLPALRAAGDPTRALIGLVARCVAQKPQVHSDRGNRAMSQLGG